MVDSSEDSIISKINLILQKLEHPKNNHESEKTEELNIALAKAQEEFKSIKVNRENAYFKNMYADFDIIVRNIRPILAKHGLSVTQRTFLENGSKILQTRLWHSSGQWIESITKIIPSKNDQYTYASAEMFEKRLQYLNLLNITVTGDLFDDDAVEEMSSGKDILAKGISRRPKYDPKEHSNETITKEQLEQLEYEIKDGSSSLRESVFYDIAEDILDSLHLRSLSDMSKDMFIPSLERIRDIKARRKKFGK